MDATLDPHGTDEESAGPDLNPRETASEATPGCSVCTVDAGSIGAEEREPGWWMRPAVTIAVSAALLATGLVLETFAPAAVPPYVPTAIFLAAAVIGGASILRGAARAVFAHRPDMSVLMTVAATGAFLIGAGAEGASVMVLYSLAEFLEEYAEQRAARSIGSLLALAPETATIRRDGREEIVHVHAVEVGETALVRPGEKVPLDGTVTAGESSVDQAAITGESVPVGKAVGDQVFAGTLNGEGYLEVRVDRPSASSTLARIAAFVREAQERQSPTEAFIVRFSRVYTPVVLAGAVLVAVVPIALGILPVDAAVYRALSLLVISCPCALALSTPITMVSGLTGAARNGILIKGKDYVETMAGVRVVAFDKTGTLTGGTPRVTAVVPLNGHSADDVRRIAAAVEARSQHPLARAIGADAAAANLVVPEVADFSSLTGRGVAGTIVGVEYRVGARDLFPVALGGEGEARMRALEETGSTVVLAGTATEPFGLIGLKDVPRPEAAATVRALQAEGIRTVIVTGDNPTVAAVIAAELGIDEVEAGVLPEAKAEVVRRLRGAHGAIAMVGDGVNDAPALAEATVGIAMGGAGSDVAIETADVVLMEDRVDRVVDLLRLARRTRGIVRQNVAVAVSVKAAIAVLAIVGLATLWEAVGFGDMGLSLLVILNALRLVAR
ncbi:MAG: cation-translocating P-type ATPase [Methanospirillum sp.]